MTDNLSDAGWQALFCKKNFFKTTTCTVLLVEC